MRAAACRLGMNTKVIFDRHNQVILSDIAIRKRLRMRSHRRIQTCQSVSRQHPNQALFHLDGFFIRKMAQHAGEGFRSRIQLGGDFLFGGGQMPFVTGFRNMRPALRQITGDALLVETRGRSRALTAQDIEDVHTLLAHEAKKRDAEWTWDNRAGDTSNLPATLVRQVPINLVLNALQAAGDGGHVAVRCVETDIDLEMDVENNGDAIPADLMKHLFEPFTGLSKEGHGLGLWVTHQIVEQLKGRIEVESRDGICQGKPACAPHCAGSIRQQSNATESKKPPAGCN